MKNDLHQADTRWNAEADFIDEKEILKRIPVSRRTLCNWRHKGLIPWINNAKGRRVLFHWPSVSAALLRNQKGTVQ